MSVQALNSRSGVYLDAYLAPLQSWLERDDITDIHVNAPGEVWIERVGGGHERCDAPGLDETTLWRLARQIASLTHQGVSREHPLLSATLPEGPRVQIVAPPATRGNLCMSIRKHVVANLSLDDYVVGGAFEDTRRASVSDTAELDRRLSDKLDSGRVADFLREAVWARKNIVVSGGTASGKTTFLNALLKEVPHHARMVIIEDTPEVKLDQPNVAGLIAVRGDQGETQVTTEDLLQAALRLRPDRIIMGELRGPEAFAFLRAVNTGHPGSVTTVHADSPRGAIDQLALMVLQAGVNLGRAEIVEYVQGVIDVFVQLSRRDGRRAVSEITFTARQAS